MQNNLVLHMCWRRKKRKMYNVVVSKIECFNKREMKTSGDKRWETVKNHNLNFLDYIKGREGVDYTPLQANEEVLNTQIKKSKLEEESKNGLFGHYMVGSLKEVRKTIKEYADRKQPIFRGILSLSEEDAVELGYLKKEKWKQLLDSKMADVAKKMGIELVNMRWVAAYHYEKGHPHIHYMLWDATERVQKSFVTVKQQNECREIFSKEIFREERLAMAQEKSLRKLLILGKNTKVDNKEVHINGITDDIFNKFKINPLNYHIMGHVSNKDISEIAKMISTICPEFPQKGGMDYGELKSKELKEKIEQIVDKILEIPAVKKEKEEYLYFMRKQYATYSFGETEEGKKKLEDKVQKEFKNELYRRLANKVIKVCKKAIKEHPDAVWSQKLMEKKLFCDSYKLIRATAEGFMKEKSRQEQKNAKNDTTKNQKLAEAKRQGKINYNEDNLEH